MKPFLLVNSGSGGGQAQAAIVPAGGGVAEGRTEEADEGAEAFEEPAHFMDGGGLFGGGAGGFGPGGGGQQAAEAAESVADGLAAVELEGRR